MFRRKEVEPSPEPGPVLALASSSVRPLLDGEAAGAVLDPPLAANGPMLVVANGKEKALPPKLLTVGPGISLSGEITAGDRLVVEGSVQVTLNQTRAIEIAETGRFTNGKAEVEDAVISGVYEGELTVRKRLLIRGSGRVNGIVRYGELQIERGGELSGSVSRLDVKD